MAKPKKRMPGAGRKPKGEFSHLVSPLSVRMPEDLRKELEQAASDRGRSVTQELLRRLHDSFDRDRDKERDPPLRALLFMIGQLAEHVSGYSLVKNLLPPERRNRLMSEWRTDPFKFKAFKVALGHLLDSLDEPPGKLQSPVTKETAEMQVKRFAAGDVAFAKVIRKQTKSPEAYGRFTAESLLRYTHGLHFLPEHEGRLEAIRDGMRGHPKLLREWERKLYGLPQARHDLELPEVKSEKPKS